MSTLEEQIEQLEFKIAFQEDSIEQLNQALVSQQKQMDDLAFQVKHLLDKVKQMNVSHIANEGEEAPPPHY